MKDICDGRRSKNDVVQESIGMYLEVFMKANQNVNVLIEVYLTSNTISFSGLSEIPSGRKLIKTPQVIAQFLKVRWGV